MQLRPGLLLCADELLGAGFGAVTVLPAALTSFYMGAALVGVLLPLFIMTASGSDPKAAHRQGDCLHGASPCKEGAADCHLPRAESSHWRAVQAGLARGSHPATLGRLPVFGPAVWLSNAVVGGVSLMPQLLKVFKRRA